MVVTYGYDYAGRPVSASMLGRTLVTSALYLPFGLAKLIVYGNGTQQAMQHDARYRLEENKLTTATGTLAEYEYTWDPAGNVLGIADAVDPGYSRTFGYDDLHRLVTANTGTSLWRSGSYAYDAMGNILFSKLGDGESVVRQEAHFKYTGTTPKVATVRNNDIIDSGEDLSRRREPRLRTNSVGYHTVTHDAAGNELSYVATRSYSARNLLDAVDEATEAGSAQHRLQHEYDGRGIGVTRRESWDSTVVATTRYVYTRRTRSFWDAYEDMKEANWKKSDKYFHCRANCDATRCGPFGYDEACEMSDFREWFDQVFKGDSAKQSEADQIANRFGRSQANKYPNQSCKTLCGSYRPKGRPGQY